MIENKNIIIAYNIADLTTARYFAAMEADYLFIDLDSREHNENIHLINQIKEWIEGPLLIGISMDDDKLKVYASLNILDGFVLFDDIFTNGFTLNHPIYTPLNFIFENSIENLKNDEVKSFKVKQEKMSSTTFNFLAYLIFIGKEVKKGFYDFEQIDSILENINK